MLLQWWSTGCRTSCTWQLRTAVSGLPSAQREEGGAVGQRSAGAQDGGFCPRAASWVDCKCLTDFSHTLHDTKEVGSKASTNNPAYTVRTALWRWGHQSQYPKQLIHTPVWLALLSWAIRHQRCWGGFWSNQLTQGKGKILVCRATKVQK
jgi:hypothetical protein